MYPRYDAASNGSHKNYLPGNKNMISNAKPSIILAQWSPRSIVYTQTGTLRRKNACQALDQNQQASQFDGNSDSDSTKAVGKVSALKAMYLDGCNGNQATTNRGEHLISSDQDQNQHPSEQATSQANNMIRPLTDDVSQQSNGRPNIKQSYELQPTNGISHSSDKPRTDLNCDHQSFGAPSKQVSWSIGACVTSDLLF